MKKISQIPFIKSPLEEQILYNHNDFTLEVCMKSSSKQIVFQMRYRSYMEAGMIPENEEGLFYDHYDFEPNTRIFLVWHQGKPVATIRSCIYSEAYGWSLTESFVYFPKELKNQLGSNTRILESNRFVVDPDFQGRQSLFARLLLFRAHGLNAAIHHCEYIITSVRANHVAFYQRFLNLDPISNQSSYIDWVDTEGFLLFNQTEQCLKAIIKRGMPDYAQEDILHYAKCAELPLHGEEQKVA